MNYKFTWQIEGRGDFRLSSGFGIALFLHDLRTVIPQLNTGIGVDAVVDALVARIIAAGHAGIRSIDDGIHLQRSDIALPEIDAVLSGCQIMPIRDIPNLLLEKGILCC